MPLSDHEQRVLEQLERQLNADDPRLATRLADSGRPAVSVRRVVLGAVLAVVGLAVVLAGVSIQLVLVGVLGTALLGAGILVATMPHRGDADAARPSAGRADRSRTRGSSLMARLERDWDDRGRPRG